MDNSLNMFMLTTLNMPLGAPIWISSDILLKSARLDMAEKVVKGFIFAISLLGIIIQNGGMKERNNSNKLLFSLYRDIYNNYNINLILFTNNNLTLFIYPDDN